MSESEGLAKLTEYLRQTRRQAEVAIDNLNGQITTLVQENEKLTNIIINLQHERDHFKGQLETLQQFNSNKAIFKERDDWRALVDSIQADRSRLQEENIALHQSLTKTNESITELKRQIEYFEEEKIHLLSQVEELESKFNISSDVTTGSNPSSPSRHIDQSTQFLLSPVTVRNGQQLQFFADSPRSIARQLKFELRKAYEQLEEERLVAERERLTHNEELSRLKDKLESSIAPPANLDSSPAVDKSSMSHQIPVATGPNHPVSWIGGFFSYFFQINSPEDTNHNMEVLTV